MLDLFGEDRETGRICDGGGAHEFEGDRRELANDRGVVVQVPVPESFASGVIRVAFAMGTTVGTTVGTALIAAD